MVRKITHNCSCNDLRKQYREETRCNEIWVRLLGRASLPEGDRAESKQLERWKRRGEGKGKEEM